MICSGEIFVHISLDDDMYTSGEIFVHISLDDMFGRNIRAHFIG